MSKTKKILIGIILITVVLLGIGYAAIQNVTLNIAGTATADPTQSNFIVKFTGIPEVSDSSNATAAITDDINATINVEGLTASGETVTATYTVQNASTDLSADLTVETTNSNEEYFVISSELGKTSIVAGEATTLTVTVELIKTPISTEETSTIGIQMTATPVQPGEEGTTNSGSGTGGTITSATLNEYGFYYGVPYSFNNGNVKYSYVFFEDGSAFYYENEIKVFEMQEGSFVYAEKSISMDGYALLVSDDGTEIGESTEIAVAEFGVMGGPCYIWGHSENDGLNHTAVGCLGGHFYCEDACGTWAVPDGGTYTLITAIDGDKTVYNAGEALPECYNSQNGDIYVCGDYEYRYGQVWGWNNSEEWSDDLGTIDEWSVRVIDDTKTEYGEICSNINKESVEYLFYTFANCESLIQSPVIPENITYMYHTFFNCTNLTTAPEIPEGMSRVQYTFRNCTNLKNYIGSTDSDGDFSNYVIPDGVWDMGGCFIGCSSLIKAPKIPESVTDVIETFKGCSSMTSVQNIPTGVNIMYGTFMGCSKLASVPEIPDSVIDMRLTFYGCTSLTTAPIIPEAVKTMYRTFYNCASLTGTIQINTNKITTADSDIDVTNNGYDCFYGTKNAIVLKGTGTTEGNATLEVLAGTANNGNVTVQ